MKSIYFIFILCVISFVSCSKSDSIEPIPFNTDESISEVYVKNGMLVVKDKKMLDNIILNNLNKSDEELKKWQDSLGFKSYQLFYDEIFSEYERVVENTIQEKSEQLILEFMDTYKNKVTFPGGTIDGAPNLTIEPKVSTRYLSVANTNGKFILGSKIVDGTKIKANNLKSTSYRCSKQHDKRKMTVHVYPDFNKEEYLVKVWHYKKTWLGWFSYKTKYYFRLRPGGPIESGHEVKSGSDLHIPTFGYRYFEIWSRGVGESQKCTFSF